MKARLFRILGFNDDLAHLGAGGMREVVCFDCGN